MPERLGPGHFLVGGKLGQGYLMVMRVTLPVEKFNKQLDSWQSGRMRSLGKRVYLISTIGSNPILSVTY